MKRKWEGNRERKGEIERKGKGKGEKRTERQVFPR